MRVLHADYWGGGSWLDEPRAKILGALKPFGPTKSAPTKKTPTNVFHCCYGCDEPIRQCLYEQPDD